MPENGQPTELEDAHARVAKLEAALVRICKLAWYQAIDANNDATQKAKNSEWTIKEMQAAGMHAWLPAFDEVWGIFNATEETIAQINTRRENAWQSWARPNDYARPNSLRAIRR